MTRRSTFARRLHGNKRGVAAVELALTAPLFLIILLGVIDFSWQMYAQQVLQGAVSQAARAATLESNMADQSKFDKGVEDQVKRVFVDAVVTFDRKAYESFDQVGDPEPFTDTNKNNQYDSGECFEDYNGNGTWDSDRGRNGNGGADDVVLYTAKMEFARVLPVWKMLGQSEKTTLTSTTVLRNQPFANQMVRELKCK
jgi:Flp pilus assembly protein TadG